MLLGRLMVRSFDRSIMRFFECSVIRSFGHLGIRSYGRSVVLAFGRSFGRPFDRLVGDHSIVWSSVIRSFGRLGVRLIRLFDPSVFRLFRHSVSFGHSIVRPYGSLAVRVLDRSVVWSFVHSFGIWVKNRSPPHDTAVKRVRNESLRGGDGRREWGGVGAGRGGAGGDAGAGFDVYRSLS